MQKSLKKTSRVITEHWGRRSTLRRGRVVQSRQSGKKHRLRSVVKAPSEMVNIPCRSIYGSKNVCVWFQKGISTSLWRFHQTNTGWRAIKLKFIALKKCRDSNDNRGKDFSLDARARLAHNGMVFSWIQEKTHIPIASINLMTMPPKFPISHWLVCTCILYAMYEYGKDRSWPWLLWWALIWGGNVSP